MMIHSPIYTPTQGFAGTDRFTYQVSDGGVLSFNTTVVTMSRLPTSTILGSKRLLGGL